MAKKNDRKKQPSRPSLSQPAFSASPAPAVDSPPLAGPESNPNAKGKGKARIQGQGRTNIAETTPELLNPLHIHLRAPVRWVYNYDHTDPLNFGYMFPIEPGSSTDLSSLNTHPVRSTLSPTASAPTHESIGNRFSSAKESPESSLGGQRQWDLTVATPDYEQQQLVSSHQQNLASSSYQDQIPIAQSLPYRYSPHRNLPPASSTQQYVTPSDEQIW
jgi:hypothetical protein